MTLFKNKDVVIEAIACAVPDNKVTIDSLSKVFGTNVTSRFTESTGIVETYRVLPEQTASDLAFVAGDELIKKTGVEKSRIGAMVVVTQSPDYRRPSNASVLQKRLELPIECACMEINLGCSGFIYGLQSAMSLMNSSDIEYALLLLGETATKIVNPNDKSIAMLYGDAGAAVLLKRKENETSQTILKSDGNRFKAIILPAGGFRDMNPGGERFKCMDGVERSLYDVYMDGASVFSFSISDVPETIKEYFELTGSKLDDFDSFLFHQANLFIVKQLIRKLKLPKEKVPVSLDRFGNTGGLSIPLTLCDAYGEEDEDRVINTLMCGFGIGLSWGVTSMKIHTENIFSIKKTKDYYKEGKIIPGTY